VSRPGGGGCPGGPLSGQVRGGEGYEQATRSHMARTLPGPSSLDNLLFVSARYLPKLTEPGSRFKDALNVDQDSKQQFTRDRPVLPPGQDRPVPPPVPAGSSALWPGSSLTKQKRALHLFININRMWPPHFLFFSASD
jgi:hypothetical protein